MNSTCFIFRDRLSATATHGTSVEGGTSAINLYYDFTEVGDTLDSSVSPSMYSYIHQKTKKLKKDNN